MHPGWYSYLHLLVLATAVAVPLQAVLLLLVWCVRVPGWKTPEGLPLRGKWLQRLLTGVILLAPGVLLWIAVHDWALLHD